MPCSREGRDLVVGMDLNDSAGSEDSFYKQVFASLKREIEVVAGFMMKQKGFQDEDKSIRYAASLNGEINQGKTIQYAASLNGPIDKDVKEVLKSARIIIEKFEQVDEAKASIRRSEGQNEHFPTDQTFRDVRSSYITQVEEVLEVARSIAGRVRQSVDAGDSPTDWSDTWSDTHSMSDMRKRLEALRIVGTLREAQIQRVDVAEVSEIQLRGVPQRFNYDELFKATRGFSEKLGAGGFGIVYRGTLPCGTPVAVKTMNADSTHGQGRREFKSEVGTISQLRHRNLIELGGWCEDHARRKYMLVYELMPNGSLDKLLFNPINGTDPIEREGAQGRTEEPEAKRVRRGGKDGPVKETTCLSWPQRFNILTGIANGLDYLHQGWKHQVIHGDIKCANILLDSEWNAKLTDFGLSRLLDHHGEAYTTNFSGTRGYVAPELLTEGKITNKSDVFAFGVVVLEVVCGRRNWPGGTQEQSLVERVKERLSKGDVFSMVDRELRGYDRQQVETVLSIGSECCEFDYQKRPSMRRVVKMLAEESHEALREKLMIKQTRGFVYIDKIYKYGSIIHCTNERVESGRRRVATEKEVEVEVADMRQQEIGVDKIVPSFVGASFSFSPSPFSIYE